MMSLSRTEEDSAIRLTSKDEEEAKRSFERYRLVFKLNMIPCQEFLRVLVRCGIFSEGTVESIEKLPTRDEKNCRILDLVSIYGGTAILKFCDALHASGHVYLSELLYSALQNLKSPDLSPLPLPKLNSKVMSPQDVAQLSAYIEQAVREGVLKETWEGGDRAKERAVSSRQKQDEWNLTNLLRDGDHRLEESKKQLRKRENERDALREDADRLTRQLEEERTRHNEDLRSQVTFGQAQERSIQRLTQRLQETDKAIEDMFLAMTSFVEREDEKETDARLPKEKLYRETSITFLDKLHDVMQHVMTKYEATMRVRADYERLQAERQFMLQFLDISCGEDNFREAFSAYIGRNEETTNRLSEKTKRLKLQLLNAKNEQDVTDNQLSAAFQEVETLKVTLKFKDSQIRKLMQDRSQLKDELTTMKRPMLATVVSKFLHASDKATPNPSDATNPPKTRITDVPGKPPALLTSESKEDLRRMLDGYYNPSHAVGDSSGEPGQSRTTKLHIVLPKDDGYFQEDADEQSKRSFRSLLESKEFRNELGQSELPHHGAEATTPLESTGQYVQAEVDTALHNVPHAQLVRGNDTQGGSVEPGNETEIREGRKTGRHLAIEWRGNARRHNRKSQLNSTKSVISDAGNKMRMYFERHFIQRKTDKIDVNDRNSLISNDVIGVHGDVRTTQGDVIAGRSNMDDAWRVGHDDVIDKRNSMLGDVIGAKGDVVRRTAARESSVSREGARPILGDSTPKIAVSQATDARFLRHNDVTAADGYHHSTNGVFNCLSRNPAPHSSARLDCDILKATYVTSRQCCHQTTASSTCRWASFGVSGRTRAPTNTRCVNCSGVEKVVRSRAGLRSAGVNCDDHQHQHKCPSYLSNYSTTCTYAWQAPEKTDASDLLQITRLNRK